MLWLKNVQIKSQIWADTKNAQIKSKNCTDKKCADKVMIRNASLVVSNMWNTPNMFMFKHVS